MPSTPVSTSCTAMDGPYPPISPPKPPNIGVAHTVCVKSTAGPRQTKSDVHDQSEPQGTKFAGASSNKLSRESRQGGINPRTSVFAESIELPVTRIKSKLEPRIEPPGVAYRGRQGDRTNPEIGIISFLCEYPRASMQSPGSKKNLLQDVLSHSNSEQRTLLGSKRKMPAAIATRRTTEGRRYSQIVVRGLYEGGDNKSTYQVNVADGSSKISAKSRLKSKRPRNEIIKTAKQREPIESLNGDGESVVVTSDQMADSMSRNLHDGQKSGEESQEWNAGIQKGESFPTLMLPLQRSAESTFGVDFSDILTRHEQGTPSPKKTKRASFSTLKINRSESRPTVRDFAGEGTPTFLSVFRQRSKSPIKNRLKGHDAGKQPPSKQNPLRKSDKQIQAGNDSLKPRPVSHEVPEISVCTHGIYCIHDSEAQHADPAAQLPLVKTAPSKQSPWIMTDGQKQSTPSGSQQSSGHSFYTKNSSTSKAHSKSPSGISAGSNDNDNLSEVSSAIISDAQSISIHKPTSDTDWGNGVLSRKPHRPGPAPTGPLPSLPEGHDVQLPSTPRRSGSSQRRSSPERSPTKSKQKTPVKYRLTPAEESPIIKPPSPARTTATTKSEQINSRPAALVRIQTANVDAFPLPPLSSAETTKGQSMAFAPPEKSPTGVSVGTRGARLERTQRLKAKDLAQERSQTAMLTDETHTHGSTDRSMSAMREDGDGHKDSIERLIDSYDTQQTSSWHRPQPSVVSMFSAATTDNRNSTRSSEFSPIIIVADQEPVTPPKPLSMRSPSSEYRNEFEKPSAGTERHHIRLSDASAQQPGSRPASEYSIQPPQPPDKSPRRSMPNHPPHKSVVNRAPTPFAHPSLHRRESQRSSQRSSLTDRDLEARMAAMEKKNRWLERAFHAVMEVSASISSGDDFQGRDSGHSYGTDHQFSGCANDSLDQCSGDAVVPEGPNDALHAGLEKVLVRQGRGRLRTWSTSSEPC